MKLIANIQISVDGVVQANGGRNEKQDPGMERGGWARPLFDEESMQFVDDFYKRADAFLFGERTYELFADYWGARNDMDNPIVNALNTKPKYVVSNTLSEPKWANTSVISGDVSEEIQKLKSSNKGELQIHGSGTLLYWLLVNGLVDELNLLVCPVIVGQGKRLFPEEGQDLALELIESRAFPKGIILQVYRPAGHPEYAS